MKTQFKAVLLGTLLMAIVMGTAWAQTQEDVIKIERDAARVIPVAITGFSGEVDSVLKFDLYVMGLNIVSPSEAEFQVTGNNNGKVEGHLLRGKVPVFAKVYQGGSLRSQAHALADDVIKVIRGTSGIFHTKIAFRVEKGGVSEIAVADFDGYNTTVVTPDNNLVNGPAWVPGQRKLFYTSWKNGMPQVFEHNLATGERQLFCRQPGSSFSPAISADGRRVAMILNKSGNPELYVCNIDGSNLKQLTRTRDDESSPCWSPDGRYVAYIYRSPRAALYKVSADGGESQRVSTAPVGGNITEPDWSPDGKTIVFTSMTGSYFNICVVSAGGGDAKVLVAGEDPSWAPNSRTVIFTRRESGKRVLSLLDVPTKHVKDVRKISGSCSQPAWAR